MAFSPSSQRKQAFRHYARVEVSLAVWCKPLAMGIWDLIEGKLTRLNLNGGLLLSKRSWQPDQSMQLEIQLPHLHRRLVGKGQVVSILHYAVAPPLTAVGIRLMALSIADTKCLADFLDHQSKVHESAKI